MVIFDLDETLLMAHTVDSLQARIRRVNAARYVVARPDEALAYTSLMLVLCFDYVRWCCWGMESASRFPRFVLVKVRLEPLHLV